MQALKIVFSIFFLLHGLSVFAQDSPKARKIKISDLSFMANASSFRDEGIAFKEMQTLASGSLLLEKFPSPQRFGAFTWLSNTNSFSLFFHESFHSLTISVQIHQNSSTTLLPQEDSRRRKIFRGNRVEKVNIFLGNIH